MKILHQLHSGLIAVVLTALLSSTCSAQQTQQDSIWQPLKVFLGSWTGRGGGEPGIGDYVRSYTFVLNNKYIEIRNKSTYQPSNDHPGGFIHEDWGYFSYDRFRHLFVLRQFHIEGFVNQYTLESISPDGRKLVFISEANENLPPGWSARETYEILSNTQIKETFELAQPDKPFTVHSQVVLERVK